MQTQSDEQKLAEKRAADAKRKRDARAGQKPTTATTSPVPAHRSGKADPTDLRAALKAAQDAEKKRAPADLAQRSSALVREVPNQGRHQHTGRWIPTEQILYTTKPPAGEEKGQRVYRMPTIKVEGFGIVDNALDDIPEDIAWDGYARGILKPEMA